MGCGPYADVDEGATGCGAGAGDEALESIAHCFATPGAGSPNTALVHAVPPVNVWKAYKLFAPYRTCCVPLNAHVPPSFAQTLQPEVGGGVGVVPPLPPVAHCFPTPGAGSPNTALVHAVLPVNVL